MDWTIITAICAVVLYATVPLLDLKVLKRMLGIALFVELFYVLGHYMAGWTFPSPWVIVQMVTSVALGVGLGVGFSKIWPISPKPGFERIVRTLLLVIPALGIGIGLQVLMQGNQAQQAIYLIFAVAAWLGSGHFVRREPVGEGGPSARTA